MVASDFLKEAQNKLAELNQLLDVNLSDILKVYLEILKKIFHFFTA